MTVESSKEARKIQRMAADLQADGIPLNLEDFGWSEESGFGSYLSINPSTVRGVAQTAQEAGLIDEKGHDYLTEQAGELEKGKRKTRET